MATDVEEGPHGGDVPVVFPRGPPGQPAFVTDVMELAQALLRCGSGRCQAWANRQSSQRARCIGLVAVLVLAFTLVAAVEYGSTTQYARPGDGDAPVTSHSRGPVPQQITSMCHKVQFFVVARPKAGSIVIKWSIVNGAHLDLRNCRVWLHRKLLRTPLVQLRGFNISLGTPMPHGAFRDGHVYEGTTYVYEVVVVDDTSGEGRLVGSATAVALDNHLPQRQARAAYLLETPHPDLPTALTFSPHKDLYIEQYRLHGVKVRIAFEGKTLLVSAAGAQQLHDSSALALHAAAVFHRLWQMLPYFPLDEFRMAVSPDTFRQSSGFELGEWTR